MLECFFKNYVSSSLVAVTLISDISPDSSKEFLDIQAIAEYDKNTLYIQRKNHIITYCKK